MVAFILCAFAFFCAPLWLIVVLALFTPFHVPMTLVLSARLLLSAATMKIGDEHALA